MQSNDHRNYILDFQTVIERGHFHYPVNPTGQQEHKKTESKYFTEGFGPLVYSLTFNDSE